MRRKLLAATCLIVLGLIGTRGAVRAQSPRSESAGARVSLGERLERFRRSLIGDEEQTEPQFEADSRSSASPSKRPRHVSRGNAKQARVSAKQPRVPQTVLPANSSRRATASEAALSEAALPETALPETALPETALSEAALTEAALTETVRAGPEVAPGDAGAKANREMGENDLLSDPAPEYPSDLRAAEAVSKAPTSRQDPIPVFKSAPTRQAPTARMARAEQRSTAGSRAVSATQNNSHALVAQASPSLKLEVHGPERILVGKPAEYRVRIINLGDEPTVNAVVIIGVPDGAELSGSSASTGKVGGGQSSDEISWEIGGLDAKGHAELSLNVSSHKGQPLALTFQWACDPASAQQVIQVEEPKLELAIDGPAEVICGDKVVYRLTVSNPGSGDAQNVSLRLLPISSNQHEASSHGMGVVAAGETKMVEIELTARQSGHLSISAEANADGGLRATAAAEVAVLKPELELAVNGPKKQFAGAPVTYTLRLNNPGTSVAPEVLVSAQLPQGAHIISTSPGARVSDEQHTVSWTLADLRPSHEEVLEVKCVLNTPGANCLEVVATAGDDLEKSGKVTTEAIALADLVLEVVDPAGPISVGTDTVYEVRVRNRGSSAAESVEILAFFSDGVEPLSAEGGPNTITPGTVTFDPIANLEAGGVAAFKVTANASKPGNHRLRVELDCKSPVTKLIQEEATLFFDDASAESSDAKPATGPRLKKGAKTAVRRATKRR